MEAEGGFPYLQKFSPSLEKCVGHGLKLIDIVLKIWALSENSAPPGVPSWLRAWTRAYTPDVLGVQRTPCKTEQGSKTCNRQEIHAEPQLVSAVVTCAIPGLSALYSLVVSI